MASQAVTPANGGNLGRLQSLLEQYKYQIAMALPRHLTPERMIRIALTAVNTTPGLRNCDPLSIAGCVVQASILGLEPNGVLGEAYLVPFKNICQLIPGYQGLLKLARNSGEILMVNAQPVHQKDDFDFEDGLEPYLKHKRAKGGPDERGPVVAYWAGASLKGGGKQFVVMTREEVEAHAKKYSAAYKQNRETPWKSEFDQMALKTCLRKLCKLLPKSVEARTAAALDEQAESGIPQRFSVDVPVELQPAAITQTSTDDEPRRKSEAEPQQQDLVG